MFWIMGGKLLGTFIGLLLAIRYPFSPLLTAGAIGILPIWIEFLLSTLLHQEPGRETRTSILILDALVDAFTFLIVPSLWFWNLVQGGTPISIALLFFVGCGAYRLWRFVRQGLDADGFFRGLPVTYTGYLWLIATLNPAISGLLIGVAGVAMVNPWIRIRPSGSGS